MTNTPSDSTPPEAPTESDATAGLLAALGTMAVVVGNGTIHTVTEPLAAEAGYDPEALVGEPLSALLVSPNGIEAVDGSETTNESETSREPMELEYADGASSTVVVRRRGLPGPHDLTGLFVEAVDPDPTDPDHRADSTTDPTPLDLGATDFERLFEAVNDAILLIDTESDRISWANSNACDLLGYSRAELYALDPEAIHPHEYDQFRAFVSTVQETGAGWTSDLSCYTCGGDVIPAEISATRVTLGGTSHLLASVRDISTRVDQRERLGRQAAAMKAATDGIAIYTTDGEVVYANHAYADLFGFETPEAVTGRQWAALHADPERFDLGIGSALSATGEWRGEVATGDDQPVEASLTRLETDEILCVAHDITDQRAHVRKLTGLATASRELLAAEDSETVAEAAVETLGDVLGYDLACVRRYEESANELALTAVSPAAERLRAEAVAYDLNASRAGTAYRRGERIRNEPGDDPYTPDDSRAELHVPIGEYGVVSVFEPEGSFDDQAVQLVELFAESVRAAFIRADRERRIRSRRAELEARTDELTVATRFNSLVIELIERMLRTPRREEIERVVCDRLADSEFYAAAWITAVEPGAEARSVSTHRVDTEPFAETEASAFVSSPYSEQLVAEAVETGAPTVGRRQFDSGDDSAEDSADETLAAAVPIVVGSRTFGVLAVAGTDSRGFGDSVESGLRLLGETLGFAFVMEATRSTLTANDAIELEFAVGGRFAELSAALDCQCVYAGSTDGDDGNRTYRIRIRGADCEDVIDLLEPRAGVSAVARLDDHSRDGDDACLVGVSVDDPAPEALADTGVNLRSLVAEDGEARLVVEAPEGIDVAALRSRLAERYGTARLVSKQHGRRERSVERLSDDLTERLTDRQLTVIETAYEQGYYEWPREATAEEVAAAVGVASSTLHQHLRAAEGKLVAAFVEADK